VIATSRKVTPSPMSAEPYRFQKSNSPPSYAIVTGMNPSAERHVAISTLR
jgi:hypothetical protein